MIVYRCPDNLEGVFTAIYTAYEQKCDPTDTRITVEEELLLFAQYRQISVDSVKAMKVSRTLQKQFGEENYYDICMALTTHHVDKAQAVYQCIVQGLKNHCRPGHLLDNLANDDINLVFKLSKYAARENHYFQGFVRFEELCNGLLFARIQPKNNLVPFLMQHFSDRLPIEDFIIYDETHGLYGVHPKHKEWYLVTADELDRESICQVYAKREEEYQQLFQTFCQTIMIKERENRTLQRNMLPLRFRGNMTEFYDV